MRQKDYMDQLLDIDRTRPTVLDQWVFLALVFDHIVGNYITFNRLGDYVDYLKERYNVLVDNCPRSYQQTFANYGTVFSLQVPAVGTSASLGVKCDRAQFKLFSEQILSGIPLYDMDMRKWKETHK